MKVVVMTMWLNEQFMAPFFLRHYNWADEIYIFLDADTVDNTEALATSDHRVTLCSITFPDGFDNEQRSLAFNRQARQCDADWLIVVDSDEFIFPPSYGDPREFLLRESADVVFARMWQVFQGADEGPLRLDLPPLFQRRYGDPNRTQGKNALYIKPCIFRPRKGIELSAGSHFFRAPVDTIVSRRQFYGVHWAFADVDEAVRRQIINGKLRLSQADINRGFASHLRTVNEESIRQTAHHMKNSPIVLRPRWFMILIEHLNRIMISILFQGDSWAVSDSNFWHNGSQPDLLDLWADRRRHFLAFVHSLKPMPTR